MRGENGRLEFSVLSGLLNNSPGSSTEDSLLLGTDATVDGAADCFVEA